MLRILRKADEPQRPDLGPLPMAGIEADLIATLGGRDSGVVATMDRLIRQAVHHRASDLHLEPWSQCLAVRFRIDGILHLVARLPLDHHAQLVARLKVLARLVAYQKQTPQEGRIDAHEDRLGAAMRVSTFPTVYGEKAVVRILSTPERLLSLEELGFRDAVIAAMREFIYRPHGVLLLTGPSSSGKTTTIYALLREIAAARHPAAHIVTVEDPVECELGEIAQTEIQPNAGFTFESALRSLLRQDPDVIMVGEIRDADTARTAIQAGLTGHLVISTIHSGTAAGVFTRLMDMSVEPFLLASAVSLVLAQRLVRVNCATCRAPYEPDAALIHRFGLKDQAGPFVRGTGCALCQGIGFRGRTALGELLAMNETLAELILARSRTRTFHEAAMAARMVSLTRDGIDKVLGGVTTLEELRLVLPPAGEEL
jgi:type IV pilus assembly protein PilB